MSSAKERIEAVGNRALLFPEIADLSFSLFLTHFDELLERKTRFPMAVTNFSHRPYSQQLGLKEQDMAWLLVDVRKKGILGDLPLSWSPHSRNTQLFDKDRCLVFGALAYFIGGRYPLTKANFLNITDLRETFPWEEIVDETKDALGANPLTLLIHPPWQQQFTSETPADQIIQEDSPPPSNLAYLDPRLSQAEDYLTADTQKPVRIEDKFPNPDEQEQVTLAATTIVEINLLLGKLPNIPEAVNPVHHQVSPHLVQPVMFILMADQHQLLAYQPDDHFDLPAFRLGLAVCKDYLQYNKDTQRLDIKNLDQLLRAIKKAVTNDPAKYWDR